MRAALALYVVLLPQLALGELCPAPPVPAGEPPVTHVDVGTPAPFEGTLLTEARMTYYVCLDLRVKEAEGKVTAADKALATLEEQLAVEKQRQISGSGSFGFWTGLALGVLGTAALVWAVK